MYYFNLKSFDIFLFLIILFKVKSSYADSLEVVAQFNIIQFRNSLNQIENCTDCMPAGIKLSKNGTILCSFPRWHSKTKMTFGKYNPEENIFEPWPSYEENNKFSNNDPSGLNSILGFEIDKDDNIYILDQGKINNQKASEKSIKLVKYSLSNGNKLKEYIFDSSIADLENSFLNDVVIDQDKHRAYITDSGISLDGDLSHYKPGIIVLDLEDSSKVHRILSNDDTTLPDPNFWLHINNTGVNKDKPMMTGVDGLALSCDGAAIFYCPLTGRMIYSILTEDIDKAIESGKSDDIKIYSAYKKEASDGLLCSSENNLYMTGIETGSIYSFSQVTKDLLQFDFRDFDSFDGNETTMWPDTLAIHNEYLYFVSNQLNNFPHNIDYEKPKNKKYNFAILRFQVAGDKSYIEGCSQMGDSWGIGTIVVFICFAIIILVVLSFVLMGSNNQEEVVDKHMNLGMIEEEKK